MLRHAVSRVWETWLSHMGRLRSRMVLEYSFDLSLIFIDRIYFTGCFGRLTP